MLKTRPSPLDRPESLNVRGSGEVEIAGCTTREHLLMQLSRHEDHAAQNTNRATAINVSLWPFR